MTPKRRTIMTFTQLSSETDCIAILTKNYSDLIATRSYFERIQGMGLS